ncbi:BMP family ABC transporter substrate-binding protein [Cohnella sp. WQ 127256]|uniref:BMP family ABC transporter substrate-binding protein n=1 Tax=Cohnella sp. WQ 127256 TaxID=2938790 RepID=UPI0021195DCF|nr:BMP family ABC transporter substrate-binding protein [Cohnella sp. WQ 127256]
MKKIRLTVIAIVLMLVALTACGSNDTPAATTGSTAPQESKSSPAAADKGKDLPKVVALLNGNLGDKSFFDSANNGMKLVQDQIGSETKVIEMGFDNTKWEPTLLDISDQDYDVIIVGTWQMQEILQRVAPQYPDKKYIIFDSAVDYSKGDLKNVYSITFKQNEASYLAGALAASVASTTELPNSNGKKLISAVAGMDIPVINDFLAGYIQGAKDVVPDVKVAISYVNDFNDTAKAKELALAQFKMGSSVGFNVAAQAGLGLIDAAKTSNVYAIGVDADQAMSMQATNPDTAKLIVTSVLKNIDNVLLRSIEMHIAGTLKYGEVDVLGIKEKAVGLADNEIYQSVIPQAMRDKIIELQAKIENGETAVLSAFTLKPEEFNALKNSVKP